MTDRPSLPPLDVSWHPEPELLDVRDPATSRPALERLGADAWATVIDYLYDHGLARGMGERSSLPELRALLHGASGTPGPAPRVPEASAAILAEWQERYAPHMPNIWHPRTLSYFTPPPLVMSVIGEVIAQVVQQGVDVYHAGPGAALNEEEVVRWLCDLVGYGEGSFGLLTSGGVMANFLAMALARDIHIRRITGADRAPRGAELEGWRIYVSDQAHFSIARALAELGFPDETLAVVPSDDRFRLQVEPVAAAIARDRAAGLRPLAIAAVAGSTNTGSVDDIVGLAELARDEGVWYHVDAAYGAAARFSVRDASRVPGLELADSVTVDPHKWFFQAYDIGGLVVKEGGLLPAAFSRRPEYYRGGGVRQRQDAYVEDSLDFYTMGFEGTRRWRALKLWMSWKHVGSDGFARLVEANDDLATHLAAAIAASEDFEAVPAEPELSVVCFRHLPGGATAAHALDPDALDAHQDRVQQAHEASGAGWITTTRLRGRTYLRAGILNYLSTREDMDGLLADLRSAAAAIPG
ncbi:MAG: pyridoxal-dependent decarboxylase [Chloroflexota bacterium]